MNTRTVEHRAGKRLTLPRTLVTGATSGIGWELAVQLAGSGVPVVALGRDPQRLQALAACNPLIEVLAADLAQLGTLEELAAGLVLRHPDLGCVINNAGIQCDLRVDDAGYGSAAIRREIDVNLTAPLILTQALLPHLLSRQHAWIVNLTSALAYAPKRTAAVYSASKAGLRLFTQALRVQLRGAPIAVVEVVMPLVDTPMTQGRGGSKLPASLAARALIEGLRAGWTEIRVGKARAVPWLQRWSPRLLSHFLQRS